MTSSLQTRRDQAVGEFAERLRAALGHRLIDLRLFGSVARGDARPDSDIDVLVVIGDPEPRWPAAKIVSNIAFDVNLEHEVFISPVVLTATMLAHQEWAGSPFIRAIQRDGVPL